MKIAACIDDLRRIAKARVPRAFFDYADSGSYSEQTLRANRADLEAIILKQRVLVDVSARDLSTTVLGKTLAAPMILAPVGLLGMQHGDGEILAARAANDAGIPFTLSTMSIGSIEHVAEATRKPFWFQLYVIKDRDFSKQLMDRAIEAQVDTLVLTVDLQVLGQRHRDVHNGLTVPPEFRIANVIDIATKPAWAWSVLNAKSWTFGNISGHVPGMESVNSLSGWTQAQFDPALNWKDLEWIRHYWPGKLVIKGILDVDDAAMAVKLGADGIVVSNHGGRQLDGASSSIRMLPRVVDAVGHQTDILFDGGIRTGADIERALALGAKAVMIGRAYAWGLGAGGGEGVAKAIDILKKELSVTMALTGIAKVSEIDGRVIDGGVAQTKALSRPEPLKLTDFRYIADITTRWMDNDVYGHINNVTYYSFFDTVVANWLIESGVLDIAASPVVGLVVDTQCSYFAPIAFPDKVRAGLRVAHAGTSSVRYEIGIFRNDETAAAAQGHFVHVYVDRKSNRPAPLSEKHKLALEGLRS